ncbi:formimidoylglutamate deiminase [Antribacter gilvus]|uniref:formimidoylglutamate deiminase n=1 Tax=Antribacter gilvus TaxID=2304675 RepID=UPI000F7A8170|nr:formimidoylglutamate deiminase [Antribacter gilvus]
MTVWYADHAWLGGNTVASGVVIRTEGGRVAEVSSGVGHAPDGATHLRGLTLPAFANGHSHAFHRALRGRTHRGGGTFWTWRDDMYEVAERLDPESYYRLARAAYAEMALAGYAAVGEFHYLHHAPGGVPYADPHAMSWALVEAARDAGIRLTLLDTAYLTAGLRGEELSPVQRRFSDGDVDAWASRVESFAAPPEVHLGAAVHSVRAVPPDALPVVAQWAASRDARLHVHLSEQRRENEACVAAHGRTPTRLLADHGVLGPRTTAVHATHLTDDDVAALASARTGACLTPTTERDLADGLPRLGDLAAAGVTLSIGSDSHAVVDPFEELRGLELGERLRTERRGHLAAADLLAAGTAAGYAALGRSPDDAPAAPTGISAGALADFTTVRLGSVRLAGWEEATLLESVLFAATSADVTDLVVGGRHVVREGRHATVEDVAAELSAAVRAQLTPR